MKSYPLEMHDANPDLPIAPVNISTMMCEHQETDNSDVYGDDYQLKDSHAIWEDLLTSDDVRMSTTNTTDATAKPYL